VMRWERAWNEPGQPPIDPGAYPEASVGLSGTHDTESLAQWWRDLPEHERAGWLALPALGGTVTGASPFVPDVRDALLQGLLGGASRYVMLPLQDAFGWDVRINTPATVTDANWTWRVPVPVDQWRESAEWVERAATLAAWSRATRRHL
ncbi:MAG: 4-alpha-glucanotransferase, partial [Acidobacteria bacterium]|nr:4-alpha-glucanotransferase [Acidobacteriota bacterium]